MKKRTGELFDMLDIIFNSINTSHKNKGTGLSFSYNLDIKEEDKKSYYTFSVLIKELGHAERVLQAIPYEKPEGMDRFNMEYQVIVGILTIFAESTFLHWDQLGKMLNTDIKFQQTAKESM